MPPDKTPITITAPAYIWRPVLDAIRRGVYRAERRSKTHPPRTGMVDTNAFAAAALAEAYDLIDAAESQHRAATSGLDECQASISDGECIHRRCPNGGSRDIPRACPLPWHRLARAIEEEE